MIHVDRDRVPRPAIFDTPRVKTAYRGAKEFFKAEPSKRAQKRFAFKTDIYNAGEVKDALAKLFHGKCAFCESKIVAAPLDSEHYRPKANCLGLDGTHYPDLYWWLAYEWTNLYIICQNCNMRKGSRFPVEDETKRVKAPGDDLNDEKPLLLDPCIDHPEQHLVFREDGAVASETERGRITIEVFALNREDLLAARKDEYRRLQTELGALKTILQSGKTIPEYLRMEELTHRGRPYAGMRNQFVAQWMNGLPPPLRKQLEEPRSKEAVNQLVEQQPVLTKSKRKEIHKDFKAYESSVDSYSVAAPKKSKHYFVHTRMLRKIQIHNFKIIRDLTIELSTGQADRAPWLMLLGENGTGKSSVLLAVALALAGERYLKTLRIQPGEVLRRRATSGFVKVYLTGDDEPIELHFSKGSDDFTVNPPEPKVYLLGYGATRLLPRPGTKPLPGTSNAHIDNLLNPFVPLKDASGWLLALHRKDKAKFQFAARAIKDILALDEDAEIDIRHQPSPRVEARVLGTWVPIEQLSDGYQSVLALVTDIMAVLQDSYENMEIAEGIVLLDEIGAHLHPRWMMRIVSRLRKTFPRVQFLTSTHDPLCLKGIFDGEVALMSRLEGNRIVMLTDLPSVQGMRVDQILTSEHFGLDSSIDPELDELFQEYYHLLALQQRSTKEETRLEELSKELDQYRVLGSTRRERILLEAADQYLAKDKSLDDSKKKRELKDETRRKVAEMWEQFKV